MPILVKSAYEFPLPKMLPVTQLFPDEKISPSEIYEILHQQMEEKNVWNDLPPGARVALLVGSRGIVHLDKVVKAAVDSLIEKGHHPFIVPAMGSHGGGVAEEQEAILKGYGVTEETMGAPVISSMETVVIGETKSGVPIHVDKHALAADAVVPINRIKTHTDYDAEIESGLCKMLAIGIGKHNGCARLHQEGFRTFSHLIPEVASVVIHRLHIPYGVAIVENAHENLHRVEIVAGDEILSREPELLTLSKSLMPRLNFPEIDILVVERMGKNITGAGMDPNIIGRLAVGPIKNFPGPRIKRIIALALTEATHGNAIGVALADYITKELRDAIDPDVTYANCIASGNPEAGKIPITLADPEEALRAAIMTCPRISPEEAKIVRIKDTLHLIDIEVSESLRQYCIKDPRFEVK